MNDLSRDLFTVMGMSAADKENGAKAIEGSIVGWTTKYSVGDKVFCDDVACEIESINPYSTRNNVSYLVTSDGETCFPAQETELTTSNI